MANWWDSAPVVEDNGKWWENAPTVEAPRNIPSFIAADMAKSGGIGLVKGTAGLTGLPGDLGQIWDKAGQKASEGIARGVEYLGLVPEGTTDWSLKQAEKDRQSLPKAEREGYVNRIFGLPVPTSKGANYAVTNNFGEYAEPQTSFGRYAQTVGEFLPGTLLAPGSIAGNALRYGVAPGVASEAVGSMEGIKGTKYEPWARAATAVGTGGLMAIGSAPAYTERVVGNAAREVTPAQFDAARNLMREADGLGIRLTADEAIQFASGGATKLSDVRRVVESTQEGGAPLAAAMAERPGQVEAASRNVLGQIAPPNATPSMAGVQLQQAAQGALDNIRQRINRIADPYYQATRGQRIDPADAAALAADPSYSRALQAIRSDPELNVRIANLPDDSVAVVNEVVKQLETMATGAAQTALNPGGNNALSAVRRGAQGAADTAATSASTDYRTACDIVRQGRETVLNPMEAGPTGRIAATSEVPQQAGSLMPRNPLPGSEGEASRAARALMGQDPDATRSVVRLGLESDLNRTGARLTSNAQPDQFGGARFAADLRGNPQRAANVGAVVEEVAGQPARQQLETLLDVLQATGTRQRPGSMTAFNKELLDDMKKGGITAVAEALARPMTKAGDAVSRFRLGREGNRLADLLLSGEAGVSRIQELAARGDNRARLLIQMLAADQTARNSVAASP